MKRILSSLVAFGVGLVLAGNASAQTSFRPLQPPAWGPGYTPSLSPYLRLTLPGDPATNYYLGTLSQFRQRDLQQDLRNFESESRLFQQQINDELPQGRPVISGTYSLRNSTSGYFNNTGNYFGSGRPNVAPIRRGVYTPPTSRAGTPYRTGPSPSFGSGGAPNTFPGVTNR